MHYGCETHSQLCYGCEAYSQLCYGCEAHSQLHYGCEAHSHLSCQYAALKMLFKVWLLISVSVHVVLDF